jgi:predicted enzyme related to lactoylglutathione lyase
MAATNIAGFELAVDDLARSEAFYTRGLGLTVRAREDHGTFKEVQVIGPGDAVALLLVSATGDAPSRSDDGTTKVAFLTDDVRGVYARAVEAGGQESQAPRYHEPSNVWFANLRDPDGYLVRLIEHEEPTG